MIECLDEESYEFMVKWFDFDIPKGVFKKELFHKPASESLSIIDVECISTNTTPYETETLIEEQLVNSIGLTQRSNDHSISIWEKLHDSKIDLTNKSKVARLSYYLKHQDIIRQILDVHHVFSVNRASQLAHQAGIKQTSYKVLRSLLKHLNFDGFLNLEIINCGSRHPVNVYSTPNCDSAIFETYANKLRLKEHTSTGLTKKVVRQKRSDGPIPLLKEKEITQSTVIPQDIPEVQEDIKPEVVELPNLKEEDELKNKKTLTGLSNHNRLNYTNMKEKLKEQYYKDLKTLGETQALAKFTKMNKLLTKGILKQDQVEKSRLLEQSMS